MHSFILFAFCFAVLGTGGCANEENEIKKGTFPYMALVYYSDETIMEGGKRFTRNAVLIRLQWLVSAAVAVGDNTMFHQKTLLARAGVTSIDSNFTLNEDEFEQEREIIQIVNPFDVNDTKQWWLYDISLLKTLHPFDNTSTVAPAPYSMEKLDYTTRTGYIIYYGKPQENATDVRNLMQLNVQILMSSLETCGEKFKKETMLCAQKTDVKTFDLDMNFCEGNKGGPLIYEDKVIGLQTYINDCNVPYLYQWLSAWSDLITCGVDEKCLSNECNSVCSTLDKDIVISTESVQLPIGTEKNIYMLSSENDSFANQEMSSLITIEEPTTTSRTVDIDVSKITTYAIDYSTERTTFLRNEVTATTTTTSTTTESPTTESTTTESTTIDTTTIELHENNDEAERNVKIAANKYTDHKVVSSSGPIAALSTLKMCFIFTVILERYI